MSEQLLLFLETPESRMQREIEKLNLKHEKLRKGQYAKYNELAKMYKEVKEDLDFIKSNICHQKIQQLRMF
jgi:hypothetical protein